ncbi:hypothetical protein [Nocardioides lianchengensis]|uniref:hypothetical protein n=1 Tax=Nocardioides lianchengensis TaxID=1045774 RepID=UPI000B87B5C0|nr:hypothetical protein [Nocardioides lianchengensis]NYG10694.1 hypothetical protein [Nocardioides lianchengensis]
MLADGESGSKPLLLLDVDGPLNPWKAKRTPAGYEEHVIENFGVRLNPAHGPMLLSVAEIFEITWCTTWNQGANVDIGPRIGLPRLPVLELDLEDHEAAQFKCPSRRQFWKVSQVIGAVGTRPFAWLDDEVSRYDRAAVRHRKACLRFVDPGKGLRQKDIDFIVRWALTIE